MTGRGTLGRWLAFCGCLVLINAINPNPYPHLLDIAMGAGAMALILYRTQPEV